MKLETKKIITSSEEETLGLAKDFAKKLKGGEVLALIGDLGSGKTVFARGLARGLGIDKPITSPTFVLQKQYEIPTNYKLQATTLIHIDAYRLQNGKDLEAIGVQDYFNDENSIVVIEWADRVKDILPCDVILLNFKVLNQDQREIRIKSHA